MTDNEIIICPNCEGKNRKPKDPNAQGIPTCGHCKQPLNDTPLQMGKVDLNVVSPQKSNSIIKILIVVCVILLIANLIKEFTL